jgi:hypothetical protein
VGITFSHISSSYWIDKLGFLLREKLAAIFITPCSWGFQLAGHLLHQLHANKFSGIIHPRAINKFFWRRCRGLKKKKLLHQIHIPPSTWHQQNITYELELPDILLAVHNVFHVSQLKKCHPEMSETPLRDAVPLEEVQLESDLTYEEKPVKILETAERNTRTKTIKFCKVQWSHHTEEEATWEREDNLREDHPHLFSSLSKARG